MILGSGDGTWSTTLYTVRSVGSDSRDVDAWAQTSLYVEDRGPPSTDDHGASPVRLYLTGPDPQAEVSDRHVSDYPIGPH
jgi:hypothetical protein